MMLLALLFIGMERMIAKAMLEHASLRRGFALEADLLPHIPGPHVFFDAPSLEDAVMTVCMLDGMLEEEKVIDSD